MQTYLLRHPGGVYILPVKTDPKDKMITTLYHIIKRTSALQEGASKKDPDNDHS
jgi:hypothetical protein